MRHFGSQRILLRTALFLLLFAVAGLSTLAKQGKYLPKANPLHYFSEAAKMELVHHPADFIPVAEQPVSRVVPPQPEFSAAPLVQPTRKFGHTDLTISFQHRAPPSWFA